MLAAYLLVVQAMLTGMTLGAQGAEGAEASGGLFAQVICHPSGATIEGAPQPIKHTGLPTCCSIGCVMSGGGMAPPPTALFAAPGRTDEPAMLAAGAAEISVAVLERSPRSTRAPPRLA
ncbi:hypothetical protein [Hansschlegelia plantiphila]|uniref:DUF2946 domain-containing protein n=1 Tax=Hansschlegelia plantiphila TaxID=374655 RepID=A0A9W6J2J0_9HYPH|nr:hypothetical protein [Hansschlegelia plantiphila]GLK68209.1 hypothetical protein GCM10008179_18470 [Hansschlegelia plantiphila]